MPTTIHQRACALVGLALAASMSGCGGSDNEPKAPGGAACPTAVQSSAAAAPPQAPRPAQPADAWQGLEALRDDQVFEWAHGPTPGGFGTARHVKLVEVTAKQCSERLASAQWRQDILLAFDATAHFDNCTFKQSIDYLNKLLKDADALAGKAAPSASDVTGAMDLLGRALHAIQDFYSHSNYVELMAAKNAPFDETIVVPVWKPTGAKTMLDLAACEGLVSGRVAWDGPHACASTVKSHGDMAKDDDKMPAGKAILPNWNRTGYRAAYQIAGWATVQFLRDMYARWPALPRTCGPVVHYLPPAERRPQ